MPANSADIPYLASLLDGLAQYFPLSLPIVIALILLAAATSALSAAVGVGGGTLLIMIMAQLMPATALIPVHGMVQLGSNGGRMAMTWRHIDMRRLLAFLPGVALGALVAAWVLIRLPEGVLELSIALFVLFTCWGPPLPKRALSRTGTLIAGAITTFLFESDRGQRPTGRELHQARRRRASHQGGDLRGLHGRAAPHQGLHLRHGRVSLP
ncbi:TSUP family transporter [Cobetia marina]